MGAQFNESFLIVVVQQKSNGSLNSVEGPRGGRVGGKEVAFKYGLGTGQKSDVQA